MTKAPTTDQIRAEIDSGQTGEKVGFPDPAAAPLGTDAEAGGHPATAADRKLEARTKTHHVERHRPIGFWIYGAVIGLIAIAALWIVLGAL